MYTLAYTELSWKVPTNYILLGLFTLAESYTVSYTGIIYKPSIIVLAAFLTLMITLGLTYYAFTTKSDVTTMGSTIFILISLMIGIGIVQLFVRNTIIEIIAASLGVVVYGFYLVYDV